MTFSGHAVCHALSKLDCTKGDDEKKCEEEKIERETRAGFILQPRFFVVD